MPKHTSPGRPLPWAVMLSLCAALLADAALAEQSQAPQERQVFTEDDLAVQKVRGKWDVSARPDFEQKNDPSAPVVVEGLSTYSGGGKYVGLHKIKTVEVRNRSQQAVASLQLSWAVHTAVEQGGFFAPGAVVLEGSTPFFDVKVAPLGFRRAEIPPIFFNKIIKPLLKNGELHGGFYVVVGVREVRFADGSLWQKPPAAA
jgi:hypothetical protein